MKTHSFNRKWTRTRLNNQKLTEHQQSNNEGISGFKFKKDLLKNNLFVTGKLIIPNRTNLPIKGEFVGQILNSNNILYGWNGDEWVIFQGNTGVAERISLVANSFVNPNLKTTLIQGPTEAVQWGARIAGDYDETLEHYNTIAMDNSDNVVLATNYTSDPAIIYNANGTVAFSLVNNSGADNYSDAAFIKYSPDGVASLLGRLGSDSGDKNPTTTSMNNVGRTVIVGYYVNDISIYNSVNDFVMTLTGDGNNDTFLLTYSGSTLEWVSKIYGSGTEQGNGCAINDYGDVFTAGYFTANSTIMIFNGNSSTYTSLTNNNDSVFMVKYGTNGTLHWTATVEGNNIYYNAGICDMNNDQICVLAMNSPSTSITPFNSNGTPGTTLSNTPGKYLGGLFSYTPTGTVMWGSAIRNSSNYTNSCRINSDGEIVTSGVYETDPLYVYNSSDSIAFSLPEPVYSSAFLIKWNPSGDPEWGAFVAGAGGEYNTSADINDLGNVVLTGYSNSTLILIYDRHRTLVSSLQQTGAGIYVVTYTAVGDFVSSTIITCEESVGDSSVAMNKLGNIIVSGSYSSSPVNAYNGHGTCAITLVNDGDYDDTFIIKYRAALNLGNPLTNGQTKIIASNGPTVYINPLASVDGSSQIIKLNQYDSVEMVWDSSVENWVIVNNEAQLLS